MMTRSGKTYEARPHTRRDKQATLMALEHATAPTLEHETSQPAIEVSNDSPAPTFMPDTADAHSRENTRPEDVHPLVVNAAEDANAYTRENEDANSLNCYAALDADAHTRAYADSEDVYTLEGDAPDVDDHTHKDTLMPVTEEVLPPLTFASLNSNESLSPYPQNEPMFASNLYIYSQPIYAANYLQFYPEPENEPVLHEATELIPPLDIDTEDELSYSGFMNMVLGAISDEETREMIKRRASVMEANHSISRNSSSASHTPNMIEVNLARIDSTSRPGSRISSISRSTKTSEKRKRKGKDRAFSNDDDNEHVINHRDNCESPQGRHDRQLWDYEMTQTIQETRDIEEAKERSLQDHYPSESSRDHQTTRTPIAGTSRKHQYHDEINLDDIHQVNRAPRPARIELPRYKRAHSQIPRT